MAYQSVGSRVFISTTTAVDTAAAGKIEGITDFNILGGAAAVIDITHLDSTAKEKMMGLPDMGQLTLTCNCDATDGGQGRAWTHLKARTKCKISLFIPDNATNAVRVDCDAYVLSMPISGAVDNKVTRNITFELTGIATIATVAAVGSTA